MTDTSFYIVLAVVIVFHLSDPGCAPQLGFSRIGLVAIRVLLLQQSAVGLRVGITDDDLVNVEQVVVALQPIAFALFVILFETEQTGNRVFAKLVGIFQECLVGKRIAISVLIAEQRFIGILGVFGIPVVLCRVFSPFFGRVGVVAIVAGSTYFQFFQPRNGPDQFAPAVDDVRDGADITCVGRRFGYGVVRDVVRQPVFIQTRRAGQLVVDMREHAIVIRCR